MHYRYMMHVVVAILGICTALSQSAVAATRLGLHVTQEELTIWRQRMTDNVNTINGFTFQSIYQNRLLADANTFRSQSHPGGDGHWNGYTGNGCFVTDGPWPGRARGAKMARSAFVFLLTGDPSYATPVRTELLSQITRPGTDFGNSAKWCLVVHKQAILETIPWIMKLLIAYDYLLAGGYTGFSATEKANIEAWFVTAGNYWHTSVRNAQQTVSPYKGLFNTPQSLACVGSACTTSVGLTYFGGPRLSGATNTWMHNISALSPMLSMAIGVRTNNAQLIGFGKVWAEAWVQLGIFSNGATADFARWRDCSPFCPGSMWAHQGGLMGAMTALIDILARTGDTSLYTFSAPTQVPFSPPGTVSFLTAVKYWAQLANRSVIVYGTKSGSDLVPARILSWDVGWQGKGAYHDFSSMAANLFYQDSEVTTAMSRDIRGCSETQYGGCYSGVWGFWPDLPFMYGNMEGKVNPYRESSDLSVSLTESPSSITSGQSSTLSWFSSNVTSCTASGGWTGSKATSGTQTVSPTQTTMYTLTCAGSRGAASASAKVTVSSPLTQVPLTQVQINSGGPAYTGTDETYEADQYASEGKTANITASIANTLDPTLYQTERYGNFTYAIPMANGTYDVTLKFAELLWTGTGQRVFNVDINGTRVLSNFDIVAQAGGVKRAIDKVFRATVSNGMLSIAFRSVVDNAKVSAIKVNLPTPSPRNLRVMQ